MVLTKRQKAIVWIIAVLVTILLGIKTTKGKISYEVENKEAGYYESMPKKILKTSTVYYLFWYGIQIASETLFTRTIPTSIINIGFYKYHLIGAVLVIGMAVILTSKKWA